LDLLKKNDKTLDKLHGDEVYVLFIKHSQNEFRYFFVLTPCCVVGGLHPLRGTL